MESAQKEILKLEGKTVAKVEFQTVDGLGIVMVTIRASDGTSVEIWSTGICTDNWIEASEID